MADKMKVPFMKPDGSMDQEIGTLMKVTESEEPWAEYVLEDGTKIRIKQTLVSIAKLDGKAAPNGDPVYAVQSQQTMSIFPNVLGNLYFNSFREKITPVFNKVVGNLLNIRNHLLLQLDLECGNISEEYFDKEESKYLTEIEKIPFEKLQEEVKMLFAFSNLPLDSEDISEMLNCSVDDAENALKNYLYKV